MSEGISQAPDEFKNSFGGNFEGVHNQEFQEELTAESTEDTKDEKKSSNIEDLASRGLISNEQAKKLADWSRKYLEFSQVREIIDSIENAKNQKEFERTTRIGFDELRVMECSEFSLLGGNLVRGRFDIPGLMISILIGNRDKLTNKDYPNTLAGVSVLEVGSYYGGSADSDSDHPVALKLKDDYMVAEYTGIDTEEPVEVPPYSPRNSYSVFEFYPQDVENIDNRFPNRQWDVVLGNAFFGYPTRSLGKEGEIKLLQKMTSHLRPGGVMWFKNNENMSMERQDIEGLGLEYIARTDLYLGMWAVRKPGEIEQSSKEEE